MTRTVVSVCGDPGGARALAPVLRLLHREGLVRIVNCAYNEAIGILQTEGVPVEPLRAPLDKTAAAALLDAQQTSCLLAGTSCNGVDLEKRFIAAAESAGIPSLGLLDFWSGYKCRFSDEDGRLAYVPDLVAVMDERARDELAAIGVAPERIVVTGQPAFDALAEQRQSFSLARKDEVRRSLGVDADALMILFLSQPLAQLYRATEGDPRFLGYDELEVFDLVSTAVAAIRHRTARAVQLVIRCHPRESPDRFLSAAGPFTIVAPNQMDGRESAMAADLVVGMNSALLLEACALGCIVLSVQPGLRHRDRLPSNEWGASTAVYRAEDLDAVLGSLLLDAEARATHRSRGALLMPMHGAARQVATHVYAALHMDRQLSGVRE